MEEQTTQQQRTDALALFSPEELRIFWDDVQRSARLMALCGSMLEAAEDELATVPLAMASEEWVTSAMDFVHDAHGFCGKARGILAALVDAWKE